MADLTEDQANLVVSITDESTAYNATVDHSGNLHTAVIATSSSGLTINGFVSVSNFPANQTISGSISIIGQPIQVEAATSNGLTVNVNSLPNVTLNQPITILSYSSSGLTISGTVTSNQGTPNTLANAWPTEITDGTNVLGTSSHPFRIDPVGTTTQPISGTVSIANFPSNQNVTITGQPIQVEAATTGGITVNVSSLPNVTLNQPITVLASSVGGVTINGTVTSNQGTANTTANAWPIKVTDGTNIGAVKAASTAAVAADPSQVITFSPNTPLPTGTNSIGTVKAQLQDNSGSIITLGQKGMTQSVPVVLASDQASIPVQIVPTSNVFFAFGDVTTAALTQAPVRRTTYTEQATNAQRSFVSSSASDTGAGTGAQQVTITFYDQTGAGPSTEVVTLNGTTAVNTVSTTIAFIDSIQVTRVGSNGSNVGIITLKAATGGGGATVWTINAGDNQTFSSHHYVPSGKTATITGISCGHNGTTVGSGAVFILKALTLNLTGAVEQQVSDFVRLYGQSSTFSRTYNSPIKVIGPARIVQYVTPETTTSIIYRGAFDFTEL